jgi:hypothetical protein
VNSTFVQVTSISSCALHYSEVEKLRAKRN